MTTDHTPAEAGTGELARVAYLVREVRESLAWDWQGERHALQTIAARLDGHRCSPSVVPGDTATDEDVRRRVFQVLYDAGMTETPPELVYRALAAAGLLATAGTEREADDDGDLLWSLFHNGRTPPTYGDEETRRYYRHVASAFRAAASPQREARGQGVGELLRTGRKVGRTIYVQHGLEPSDDDPLIGLMDTPELAQRIVESVNGAAPRAVAPVGNVDRDALAEAFMAEWRGAGYVNRAEGVPQPSMEACARLAADFALAVLREGEQR